MKKYFSTWIFALLAGCSASSTTGAQCEPSDSVLIGEDYGTLVYADTIPGGYRIETKATSDTCTMYITGLTATVKKIVQANPLGRCVADITDYSASAVCKAAGTPTITINKGPKVRIDLLCAMSGN